MGFPAHRNDDLRLCRALTVVEGQSTVFVNGKLWAVDDDPNTHEEGRLLASHGLTVTINGRGVIVHAPDIAKEPDLLGHGPIPTQTDEGSGNVFAY